MIFTTIEITKWSISRNWFDLIDQKLGFDLYEENRPFDIKTCADTTFPVTHLWYKIDC